MLLVRVRAVPRLAGVLALTAFVLQTSPAQASAKQRLGIWTLRNGTTGGDVCTLQSELTKAGFKTPLLGTSPRPPRTTSSGSSQVPPAVNRVVTAAFVRRPQMQKRVPPTLKHAWQRRHRAGPGWAGGRKAQVQAGRRRRRSHERPQQQSDHGARRPARRLPAPGRAHPQAGDARPRRPRPPGLPEASPASPQRWTATSGAGTKANVVKFEQANGPDESGVDHLRPVAESAPGVAQAMTASGPAARRRSTPTGRRPAGGRAPGGPGDDHRGQLDHRHLVLRRWRPR